MLPILQFAFVAVLPVVVVAGALATLFLAGALLEALEHPEQLSARVEAAFRRPLRAARTPSAEHYYKPYWQAR